MMNLNRGFAPSIQICGETLMQVQPLGRAPGATGNGGVDDVVIAVIPLWICIAEAERKSYQDAPDSLG